MADVENITTTILQGSPDLLRNPNTADTPGFAFIGNLLGFGGDSGLTENRQNFEWEMGCISWQNPTDGSPRRAIKFRINPSDVSWSMAQRSQEQKTKAGTVLHVWNDRDRQSYFDEPVITLNLQTGNILPVQSIVEPGFSPPSVPEGLCNFYEFMALVDEVKVLDDGRANLVYIDYNSLVFPRIRLWGFFTPNGISFSDRADNHAQVNDWTASFTVYKSQPKLGRAISLAITSGRQAGQDLKTTFRVAGYPYLNRRSETFKTPLQTLGGVVLQNASAENRARISAASRRLVSRRGTALAGAVATRVSGTPQKPIWFRARRSSF